MRKAVYTVITGGYDTIKTFPKADGWEYVLFTDDRELKSDFWQVKYVKKSKDPVKQQRDIKIRPHHYLPGYDLTIYIDATHTLTKDINYMVNTCYKGGMLLARHGTRSCVYQEAKRIIELNKARREDVDRQVRFYAGQKFRTKTLYETGFMVRDRSVTPLMEHWADQVKRYTHRDQLSLPYSVQETGITPHVLPSHVIRRGFTISRHLDKSAPRVWHLTPYAVDGNIGREYNRQIAMIPDADWICIRDGDTCFTTPDSNWGRQIADVIRLNPGYALIGCVTNRLAADHQLYGGQFCENPDWNEHKRRGAELYRDRYSEVTPIRKGIAGMFMLFPKSTWKRIKFKEIAPFRTFDSDFSNKVLRIGRIGLAEGIYIFHDYRWGQENPKSYTKHLR